MAKETLHQSTARTQCTQEKGIYEPTRTRLFSFLEHEVERRRKDSDREYIFDKV